jgi:ABC-type multidrug transport system ATPase subunit
VKIGGKEINPVKYRRNIAYVMQDDALMPTATPREALTFSATLRLPSTVKKEDIDRTVDKVLNDLGLTDCADVIIGGALIKGISGGQRKRTSVGVEIITDPNVSIIFSFLLLIMCDDDDILLVRLLVIIFRRTNFWFRFFFSF